MNRTRNTTANIALLVLTFAVTMILSFVAAPAAQAGDDGGAPAYNHSTRVVDGVTLHEEKIYTKAEVDKIVQAKQSKAKAIPGAKTDLASVARTSGMYQIDERQYGPEACQRYSANGQCLDQGKCPLGYLRLYYDGYQNMARNDHSSNGTICGNKGYNTNGQNWYTSVWICVSRSFMDPFYPGQCIDGDRSKRANAGFFSWYAGPVYSGGSAHQCVSAEATMQWRQWYQPDVKPYTARLYAVHCG